MRMSVSTRISIAIAATAFLAVESHQSSKDWSTQDGKNRRDTEKITALPNLIQEADTETLKPHEGIEKATTASKTNKEADERTQRLALIKAKAEYASAVKIEVNGQVSIAIPGNETTALNAVYLDLFSQDQMNYALNTLTSKAEDEQTKLRTALDDSKVRYLEAKANMYTGLDSFDLEELTLKYINSIAPYRRKLRSYYFYNSQHYYASGLPTAITQAETDIDGKFAIRIPKTGIWVLVAQGQRAKESKVKEYLWLIKVGGNSLGKNQIVLNNENLCGSGSPDSILTKLDEDGVDKAVASKMGESDDYSAR